MKKSSIRFSVVTGMVVVIAAGLTGCNKNDDNYGNMPSQPVITATVFSSAGDSAAIVAKLEAFRQVAGAVINNAPGANGGRREVNWDGVPSNLTNNNNFPFDFFGAADPALPNGRKRGLLMAGTGNGFRVDSSDFSEIDASYAGQFEVFSKKRLFITAGSTETDISFSVPGTTTPAFVKSFAVIFSDVDDAASTTVQFFSGSKSLGIFKAQPAAQGFTLLGVHFPDEKVSKVKIISGNGVLAPGTKDLTNGGTKDLVVMDDFIYDEPKQIN